MRVTAIGAYMMKGTAKKSGSAYAMEKLVIRVPQENVAQPNMQKIGYGFGIAELDLEEGALAKYFAMNYPPEGVELDLETGATMRYGRLQTVIVACKKVPPLKSAA